jgi:bifunctional non-homologous end joining protein LigD
MARNPEALLRQLFPPMLATLTGSLPKDEENWIFELKYDGFRAIAAVVGGSAAMWSRNAIDLSTRFPRVFAALKKVKAKEAVIDGEITALDEKGAPRFQLLQRGEEGRTFCFVFDLLWLDGVDLRQRPLEERRRLLEKLLRSRTGAGSIIRLAEQMQPPAKKALEESARRGFEGLIAKRRSSRYDNRRSREWLKIKAVNAQEFAIVGFTPSTHSTREIGSLILGVVDNGKMRYAGRVGTGFSAKQRVDLRRELARDAVPTPPIVNPPRLKGATWVEPRFVAQVRFTEWTADGSLRHPSFLGLRPDKSPWECVVERPVPTPPPDAGTRGRGDGGTRRGRNRETGGRGQMAKKGSASSRGSAAPRPRVSASSRPGGRTGASRRVEVTLSSPDRILYPRDGITKQDVADYYEAMAEPMIRALGSRPLALEHWNAGIDRPSWFQQNIGREAPPWMTLVETPTRTSNRSVRHLVIDRPETLRWLAQHSVLTIHMWSSRAKSLESPDWVVFDLDPAKGKGIQQAVEAALVLRKLLDQLRVPSVPKTSGKRGIHVFVPLIPGYTHEDAVEWACRIAEAIADKVPYVTVERSISKRRGRLYFDCLQNGYGKTVVAPYSLRAIDGAPVSAPLQWSEVTSKLDPLRFNLRTMPERLAKIGDLFRPAVEGAVHLPRLR